MSIFIARHFKKEHNKTDLYEIASQRLPRKPKSYEKFSFEKNDAAVFFFNAALDRNPVNFSENEVVILQGYGDKNLEFKVRNAYIKKHALDLINFPEAFCAVRVHKNGIEFAGSAVGADPLFFYEDENLVVVTNRHNLLAPWVKDSALRKDVLAWMVGRGHIGDFNTCWEKIKKTRPGSLYQFIENKLIEHRSSYENLFEPIEDIEIESRISEVSHYFQKIIDSSKSDVRFWLSGGKDSRAIVGLLSGAKRFDQITFQTHGEKFAPDVMAANLVAHSLGVTKNHSTMSSSLNEPTIDIATSLARDLLSDSTGSSLADFRLIPNSDLLIFGGHESGYKTNPNELNLEEYLKSRRYWPDNQGILKSEIYQNILKTYESNLRNSLGSIPKEKYPQLEALLYVIGTRVTAAHVNSHVSRSEIHPFLDGRMIRLLFGVSNEALKNQIIHYVMMRQSSSPIESLPFAADNWPSGTADFAKKIRLPFRASAQNSYKFMDYFPSQKNFGGYSWRLDLIQRTRQFMKSYIYDNKGYFDFINLNRFEMMLAEDISELKISSIYSQLALLKTCLTHFINNGTEIFDFNKEKLIAEKINYVLDEQKMKPNNFNIIDAYKKKIHDYEVAIALAAERDRSNSDVLQKTINNHVAHALVKVIGENYEKLEKELTQIGYKIIPKNGLLISKNNSKINLRCYILNTSKKNNTLLIAVKNRSPKTPLKEFNWSKSGDFWFKYIPYANAGQMTTIDLEIGSIGDDVYLLPWYCNDLIFFSEV